MTKGRYKSSESYQSLQKTPRQTHVWRRNKMVE